MDKSLEGLRILVVEDNFLAAEVVRDALESTGCTVIGPVARLEMGLQLAEQQQIDGAVLDINLNGDRCFPIAEALRQRGVPFIFLTGYDDAAIPCRAATGATARQVDPGLAAGRSPDRGHLSLLTSSRCFFRVGSMSVANCFMRALSPPLA